MLPPVVFPWECWEGHTDNDRFGVYNYLWPGLQVHFEIHILKKEWCNNTNFYISKMMKTPKDSSIQRGKYKGLRKSLTRSNFVTKRLSDPLVPRLFSSKYSKSNSQNLSKEAPLPSGSKPIISLWCGFEKICLFEIILMQLTIS